MSSLVDWLVEHEPTFRKSRLPSLYSDLAQLKASNPDGFAANATAWQSALTRAALAGRLPDGQKVLLGSSTQLLDDLRSPQYGLPTGLGVVLDESVRSGKMWSLKDFDALDHSIYAKTWLPGPWTVVQWTLQQAGVLSKPSFDQAGRLRAGKLVLIDALEEATKQLTALQQERGNAVTDRVMTRDAFSALVAQTHIGPLSRNQTDILLKFLSRDKQLLSYDSQTVKFKATSAAGPEKISEEDVTIASIKSLIGTIESQVVALNARVTHLQSTAQSAVQSKNKPAAMSALRSKKLAEQSLQSRTETLHKLEEVYMKLEQAVDQVQIVQVMQSSADALKNLNMRVGGVDKVDSVMEDLREQMGQVDEVGQILQEPLHGATVVDEAEVDQELEALENEEKRIEEQKQAEVTRTRLAELERADNVKSIAKDKSEDEVIVDRELEESSQKLEKMRLDDGAAEAEGSRHPALLEAT